MAQEQDDRNDVLMQHRAGEPPRDQGVATHGRLPYPNEIIGGRTEPPFEVIGMDALSPLLMHVDFPATKAQIAERIGQARVPIDKLHTRAVADILEQTSPETFRSSREVEAALARILEQSNTQRGANLSERQPN